VVLVVVLASLRQKKNIAIILAFLDLVHCNKSACRYNHLDKRRTVRRRNGYSKGQMT
jgi:hypothetical protein